ncbi:hypothetical protein ACHAWF_006842 [Thalassiosira exigua]
MSADLSAYCRPVGGGSYSAPGGPSPGKKRDAPPSSSSGGNGDGDAPPSAAPKELKRRCIDYHTPAVLDLTSRLYRKPNRRSHAIPGGSGSAGYPFLQGHTNYLRWMGLPAGEGAGGDVVPSVAFLTSRTSRGCLSWTPGGRRLLTGNQEGEFTLWDGINFSFELIMSAHDQSFRSMAWSHNQNYLPTSDSGGNIKYWSPSIAPVQSLDSHNGQPVHALSFSPADTKVVSCGDDATVRVWDWAGHREERTLEGHGWDVKCVQWHPRSSVICSGSKDNMVKAKISFSTDPFEPNAPPAAVGSADRILPEHVVRSHEYRHQGRMERQWELAADGELRSADQAVRHPGDAGAVLFEGTSQGGYKRRVASRVRDGVRERGHGRDADLLEPHDMAIWDMKWHPAGHLLATGSNDRQTKFWARNRPGTKQGLDDDGLDADGGADAEIVRAESPRGDGAREPRGHRHRSARGHDHRHAAADEDEDARGPDTEGAADRGHGAADRNGEEAGGGAVGACVERRERGAGSLLRRRIRRGVWGVLRFCALRFLCLQ